MDLEIMCLNAHKHLGKTINKDQNLKYLLRTSNTMDHILLETENIAGLFDKCFCVASVSEMSIDSIYFCSKEVKTSWLKFTD